MSGYTPLFDTLTSGTLCGRWPDIGLWAVVLSMSDRHGVVDVTPTYIASVTGLPVDDVAACMERFCQPDKYSRSQEADGARLRLIDPARPWGWLIVNHSKYREKARKSSYDSARTASGLDAERKRMSRDVPTPPAPSRSQTETKTKTKTEDKEPTAAARPVEPEFAEFRSIYPERNGNQPWGRAKRAIAARLIDGHNWQEILDGTRRYAAWCKATGKLNTEVVLQAATFCGPDKPFLKPWTLPATKADARLLTNLDSAAEAERRIFGGSP
jgi:hypothetical protein